MNRAQAIAKAADRRLWVRGIVAAAGPCVSVAMAVGLGLVAADRVFALRLPVWALVAAPAALGFAATVLVAARLRAREGDAAVVLDNALGLRDRISSSLALERAARNGDASDPFFALARSDAERAAEGADVRRAIPLRFDNWWVAAPALLAGLVAAALYAPVFDVLGAEERRVERVALEEERESAAEDIEAIREELREATANTAADAATPEQLRALEDLEQELAQGRVDPDDARAQAASRLDDLAEGLDDLADRDDRALDALGERFASLDERAGENAATKPLEDALRRNDWERAAEALEQLEREIARDSGMDEAARRRAAEDLRNLSRALEQAAASEATEQAGGESSTEQQDRAKNNDAFDALRERGVPSELARDLADAESADEVREALEEQGAPPEQADRLAERIAEENRARAAEEQANRDLRDLADALDRAAEDAENPPAPDETSPPEPSPTQTPPDEPMRPGDAQQQQQQQQGPSQEQRTPSGGDQRPEQSQSPSERESEKDPGAPQRQPQQGPAQDVGSDQGDENTAERDEGRRVDDAQRPDGQPQEGTEDAEGASKDDAASPSDQESPPGAQQSQRDSSGRGAGQESPTSRPGGNADRDAGDNARPAEMDGAAGEGDRSSQGRSNSGTARALDKMRELAQRRSSAQQSREEAERLRERAERMLQEMSPEEREEMRRLAEQIARERGGPLEDLSEAPLEIVDARRPGEGAEDDGRVIAEWLSEGRTGADNARGTVDARRRLAEAAQGAQRAIEEQQTPARYADLIRRYFKRLPDAVERAAPAQDAQDVTPPAKGDG